MPQLRSVRNLTSHVYPSPGSLAPWSTRMRWAGAMLVTLLGLLVTPSWAGDNESTRATLRGLPGMAVLIENLAPEVERAGFTRRQLQTDVELRLRQAGIRVLTEQERLTVVGQPMFVYKRQCCPLLNDLHLIPFNINVVLYRKSVPRHGCGGSTWAATWITGMIGSRMLRDDFSHVRDE